MPHITKYLSLLVVTLKHIVTLPNIVQAVHLFAGPRKSSDGELGLIPSAPLRVVLLLDRRAGIERLRPGIAAQFAAGIEQGADNVVILVPDASAAQGPTVRVMAHVDKRRGGPPCREGVALAFDRARQRFADVDEFSPAAQSAESSDLEDGAWVE